MLRFLSVIYPFFYFQFITDNGVSYLFIFLKSKFMLTKNYPNCLDLSDMGFEPFLNFIFLRSVLNRTFFYLTFRKIPGLIGLSNLDILLLPILMFFNKQITNYYH